MTNHVDILMVATGLVLALAAFAVYRWQTRRRTKVIEMWIREYLSARYGGPPISLHINCTDDPLWPVLVEFDYPHSGTRHRLQFECAGSPSTCALISEK